MKNIQNIHIEPGTHWSEHKWVITYDDGTKSYAQGNAEALYDDTGSVIMEAVGDNSFNTTSM